MADVDPMLPFHFESDVELNTPANTVFSHLDDHSRLSAHMSRPSWMMVGSRMAIELDASEGRAVGAIIHLRGRVLGIPLSVEEIVTERSPPLRKVWGTTGRPQLLVIGPYRMGYEITPKAQSSQLRVFIDYALPDGPISHWLGRLFGNFYARWCTQRMANDAAMHFQKMEMDDPGSTPRKPRRRIAFLIFLTCGIWLIGLGFYFALLRPALLPEDPRYIGSSLAQIQSALPGLDPWLSHVFIVMGGFMAASGLLTIFLAATAVSARQKGTGTVLLLAGFATVVTMSWTNFVIDSNFKWLLLAPAVLWFTGIAAYIYERHD